MMGYCDYGPNVLHKKDLNSKCKNFRREEQKEEPKVDLPLPTDTLPTDNLWTDEDRLTSLLQAAATIRSIGVSNLKSIDLAFEMEKEIKERIKNGQ